MAFDYQTLGTGYTVPISEALSRAAVERTIGLPFRIDADGTVARAEGRSNIIRQEMLTAILTYLGERVMMPFQGSHIAQFVWEPQSGATTNMLLNEVSSLVRSQFPSVSILNLSVIDSSEEGELSLQLDYSVDDIQSSLPIDVTSLLLEGQ